ncbi:MAG TPA: hypothetical protein VE404_08015 [Verrucomicrobiae bacterium]|nr:hypothetical protein [Verrucomicrobiae bacterium]
MLVIAAIELVVVVRAPAPGRAGIPPVDSFQRGMVLGLFSRDDPGFVERAIGELRDLGVDSISIAVPWAIPDVRSIRLAPRSDMTPGDASLRRAIRQAHLAGMRVLLLPLIYVDRMDGPEWRGTLAPADWGAWFAAYDRMILRYAALAASEKVEYFSVGSELCSTEGRRDEWRDLITRVRRVYGGLVTYSANWDHRDEMTFGESLDFLGMNAYFSLSGNPDAGLDDLVAAWTPILEEIERWRSKLGLRVVVTEVGYPSRRGAASNPWAYDAPGAPDTGAQQRGYAAFVRAWTGYPSLAGVYFYMWWGDGGPADSGYTPRGKPAASVVSSWYHESRMGDKP